MKKTLLFIICALSTHQAWSQEDAKAKANEEVNYQLIKGAANKQKADDKSDQTLKGYEKAADKAYSEYNNSAKGASSSGKAIQK